MKMKHSNLIELEIMNFINVLKNNSNIKAGKELKNNLDFLIN